MRGPDKKTSRSLQYSSKCHDHRRKRDSPYLLKSRKKHSSRAIRFITGIIKIPCVTPIQEEHAPGEECSAGRRQDRRRKESSNSLDPLSRANINELKRVLSRPCHSGGRQNHPVDYEIMLPRKIKDGKRRERKRGKERKRPRVRRSETKWKMRKEMERERSRGGDSGGAKGGK